MNQEPHNSQREAEYASEVDGEYEPYESVYPYVEIPIKVRNPKWIKVKNYIGGWILGIFFLLIVGYGFYGDIHATHQYEKSARENPKILLYPMPSDVSYSLEKKVELIVEISHQLHYDIDHLPDGATPGRRAALVERGQLLLQILDELQKENVGNK